MLRSLLGYIFRGVGYPAPIAEEILDSLWSHRGRLVVVSVSSFATPLLELGVIGTMYALVSPEYQAGIHARLSRFDLTAGLAAQFGNGGAPVLLLASVALVALLLMLVTKFAHGRGLAYFQFTLYTNYAQRIMSSYLHASPSTVTRISRDAVTNGVLMQAGAFGKSVAELMDVFAQLLTAALFLLGALRTSVELVVTSLAVAVVVSLVAREGFRRERAIGLRKALVQPRLLGQTSDTLRSYAMSKILGAESYLARSFGEFVRTSQRWRLDRNWNELRTRALTDVVVYLSILLVIIIATTLVKLDTALLLVFLVIMARLQRSATTLQSLWIRLNHAMPELEIAHGLIEACEAAAYCEQETEVVRPDPMPVPLRFSDVRYRYREDARWVLDGIDLDIAPGETILIQGRSGVGKSTLILVGCGLVSPAHGQVLYGEQVLDEGTFYQLRGHMAYVGEGAHLFRDSIRENLTLGRAVSDTQLNQALEKARLMDLVRASPEGMDTPIGENGANLSLGERQRVMLAQVFLREPQILFLDEATANLDIDLEHDILEDLFDNLPGSTTVLMVAHRRPAGIRFDRAFHLRNGKLRPTVRTGEQELAHRGKTPPVGADLPE